MPRKAGGNAGSRDEPVLISQGKSYEYTGKAYSSRYPVDEMDKLTNGLIAGATVGDPQWVGFYATEPVKVKIDLEGNYVLSSMRSHHYAGTGGVAYPSFIRLRASRDGESWSDDVVYQTNATWPDGASTAWYTVEDFELAGRYVEVEFEWHESAGGSQNIFVSEIELYGKPEEE